jgi:hypothetical protein
VQRNERVSLSGVLSALSYALDLTEGATIGRMAAMFGGDDRGVKPGDEAAGASGAPHGHHGGAREVARGADVIDAKSPFTCNHVSNAILDKSGRGRPTNADGWNVIPCTRWRSASELERSRASRGRQRCITRN